MELQSLLNIGVGVVLAGVGWFSRQIWDAVSELRRDIHEIEVDLPKTYVRKDEFVESMKEVKTMLEKIFDKLDGKVDKR
jgi:predicted RNA-binding protein with EMAP domain